MSRYRASLKGDECQTDLKERSNGLEIRDLFGRFKVPGAVLLWELPTDG